MKIFTWIETGVWSSEFFLISEAFRAKSPHHQPTRPSNPPVYVPTQQPGPSNKLTIKTTSLKTEENSTAEHIEDAGQKNLANLVDHL